MSLSRRMRRAAAGRGGGDAATLIEDVFDINLWTGTGAALSVTGSLDHSANTAMVLTHGRSNGKDILAHDTVRRVTKLIDLDSSSAGEVTDATAITAFNSDGYSMGTYADINTGGQTFAGTTWLKADNFFDVQEVTKVASSDLVVDLSSLGTIGMVVVKRLDAASVGFTWHKDFTSGSLADLDNSEAEYVNGSITVSGTDLTLEDGVITDGDYLVFAFAHDTGANGLIECGTYAGDGTTDGSNEISLTFGEPQFVLIKRFDFNGGNWVVVDTTRGMQVGGTDQLIDWNRSAAEGATAITDFTSNGFKVLSTTENNINTADYIYVAIKKVT